ncbi:diaminopimelate epimerase [Bacillus sp. JJ1764]|uniref:diaminopimelate epimerase n=1 Tax=Bacillus sp. JJ1764 TaxID=3122964 RepID=UPI002FFD75A8
MRIEFIKGHGSGNDFFIIDEITNQYAFSEQERADMARLLCDRKTGMGADGILFIMKSDHADARMRVFNADGSEASMCGNGLRLVARYVCELLGKKNGVIETMKADLKVGRQEELFPEIHTYQVEISPVLFDLESLPLRLNQSTLVNEKIMQLSDRFTFTALAVPNPHLITLVETEDLQNEVQRQLSEYVNGPNELFPDGVNVSFVKSIQENAIYVRTYERGVGFTNACGTAMSASSLVTCLQKMNRFEEVINVYNNGGMVQCVVHEHDGTFTIDLIGNATYQYKADVEVNLHDSLYTVISKKDFLEQPDYEKLQQKVQQYLKENM